MQQQNKHQQSQQRVSPMMLNVGNQAGSKNTLSVSPGPGQHQRVPSPQELVLHTQNIMQNALIRRKLEEQKENYRRRQDQNTGTFRERSSSDSKGNGNGNPCGDSPQAFTPLSVMKKMAADRRDSDPKVIPELKLSQACTSEFSDAAVGPAGDAIQRFSSQHNSRKLEQEGNAGNDGIGQFSEDSPQFNHLLPDTRENFPLGSTTGGMLQQIPLPPPLPQAAGPNNPLSTIHLQQVAAIRAQQLQNQWNMHSGGAVGSNRHSGPFPPVGGFDHFLMQQQPHGPPLPAHIAAAAAAAANAVGNQFPPSHQLPQLQTMPGGNQQQQQMATAMATAGARPFHQSSAITSVMNTHGTAPSISAPGQGGLSKFFSPEVLAQAQSGNAPSMPPLPTQKALTLEEIELQAAAMGMRI